jgi:hypothetical protein
MLDFILKVVKSPNIFSPEERMSKAAAFIYAFTFLHSLPNALLLLENGKKKYDDSVKDAHKLKLLPVFEIYLTACYVVHSFLAFKSGITKRKTILILSGLVIGIFTLKHISDFRLGEFRSDHSTPSEEIEKIVRVRNEKLLYILGVLAVALHTYKGISPGWLFRLGFRGDEIRTLLIVGRVMLGISLSLYLTPLIIH